MSVKSSSSALPAVSVAVAQFAAVADVAANLATIARLAEEAAGKGAEVAVFPEASMFAFTASAEELAATARRAGRQFESEILAIARRVGITLVVGMYSDGGERLSRNTFIVAGANGAQLGRYEKLHLYDAFHYRESEKNERAPLRDDFAELCTFDVGGLRFGVLNCYDLRFPEMARVLIDRGADVLVLGAGWVAGPLKELHWETLIRARAIENTCFVAAACQPAPLSVGLSMIVDPSGVVMATVPGDEGVAVSRLESSRLQAVREILPCLQHRRYAVVPRQPSRDEASERANISATKHIVEKVQ
jgi:predicted amidohydrolase